MRLLSLLTFVLSFSLFAQDYCPAPTSTPDAIEKCIEDILAVLAANPKTDDIEVVSKASLLFLEKYQNRLDFDSSIPLSLLERINRFLFLPSVSDKEKSKLCLLKSGLYGRLSEKQKSLEQGKEAIGALKKSIQHDRTNKNAATAYATAILAVKEKPALFRMAMTKALKLDIDEETKAAIKALENAGLTNDSLYVRLRK